MVVISIASQLCNNSSQFIDTGSEVSWPQADWIDIIPIIISIISLCVAIGSWQNSRKAVDISASQERDRQKDMRKARLTAQLTKRHNHQNGRLEFSLQIKNNGKAKAREIEILIDDKPATKYIIFGWSGIKEGDIPRELGPGESWDHPLRYGTGIEAKFNIKLNWYDDSEEYGNFEKLLIPI